MHQAMDAQNASWRRSLTFRVTSVFAQYERQVEASASPGSNVDFAEAAKRGNEVIGHFRRETSSNHTSKGAARSKEVPPCGRECHQDPDEHRGETGTAERLPHEAAAVPGAGAADIYGADGVELRAGNSFITTKNPPHQVAVALLSKLLRLIVEARGALGCGHYSHPDFNEWFWLGWHGICQPIRWSSHFPTATSSLQGRQMVHHAKLWVFSGRNESPGPRPERSPTTIRRSCWQG